MKRNAAMFEKSMKNSSKETKARRGGPELRDDFLKEIKRKKVEKEQNKSQKDPQNKPDKAAREQVPKDPECSKTSNGNNTEKLNEKVNEKKLTPAERLAKLRAAKEEAERERLDSIANNKNSLDKIDMKLVFSTRW